MSSESAVDRAHTRYRERGFGKYESVRPWNEFRALLIAEIEAESAAKDTRIAELEAEVANLRGDRKRLDWLSALVTVNDEHAHRSVYYYEMSVRTANGVLALRNATRGRISAGWLAMPAISAVTNKPTAIGAPVSAPRPYGSSTSAMA